MAATPTGTLIVSPELSESQRDSLIQRSEGGLEPAFDCCVRHVAAARASRKNDAIPDIAEDLVTRVWAIFLMASYPEEFDGDPEGALKEARRIRKEDHGVRPMPNGYRRKVAVI